MTCNNLHRWVTRNAVRHASKPLRESVPLSPAWKILVPWGGCNDATRTDGHCISYWTGIQYAQRCLRWREQTKKNVPRKNPYGRPHRLARKSCISNPTSSRSTCKFEKIVYSTGKITFIIVILCAQWCSNGREVS